MAHAHNTGKKATFICSVLNCTNGFQSGTWNFFEASHGKGAPDGVGGLLKRTADRLVSHGTDIPNAEFLFNTLVDAQTSVKLVYISEDSIKEATKKMPNLPVVPNTMHIHQVVTHIPRQIRHRDVSCLCPNRQNLECECYNPKTFIFGAKESASNEDNIQNLPAIPWQNTDTIGQWCYLKYDNTIYPGVIQDVNETYVLVKCMHRVGNNRFFWPQREDILWYLHEDIMQLIPAPASVTSRHVEINRDIWSKITEL